MLQKSPQLNKDATELPVMLPDQSKKKKWLNSYKYLLGVSHTIYI